jgi:predicted metalloenzyme YecM
MSPQLMYADIPSFMCRVERLCQLLRLDLTGFELDHIAMRINNPALATAVHLAWLQVGTEVSCTEIAGRPIVVIELRHPLQLGSWETRHVELPYPAPGKIYPRQGWEHVEFVIPTAVDSVDLFKQNLFQRFPSLRQQWGKLHQHRIGVKLSLPQAEGERLANPTIAFQWQGLCLKLHPHSLREIIDSQES